MKKNIKKILIMITGILLMNLAVPATTEDETNTIHVVKRNVNSVVFVTNIQRIKRSFLEEQQIPKGAGSGFIWDNLGHIVTNYHVIEEGNLFAVTLPNQETRQAKLVGAEINKDIAVLKIEGDLTNLLPVTAGSSKDLQVGQKTIAIGNPFGLDYTVTTGIVSALGRRIIGVGGVTIRDMIQTDASINPGNSGGPLLNSDGLLIGMNTMIYSKTGTSAGIGFAVPIDTIKKIVPQIIKFGKVIRPGIGVSLLPDSYARRLDIEGAIIMEVHKTSEAFRAGLRGMGQDRNGQIYLQDIIVGIDDNPIKSYDDLYNLLDQYRVGDKVVLIILRNGDKRKVTFTLVRLD